MEKIIGGITYNIGIMDAFTQLHVARRMGSALPIVAGMVDSENSSKDMSLLVLLMLSKLTDEEADYIMGKCLTVVQVKQAAGWAVLYRGGALMFSDTSVDTMLQLASGVINENLGDFFRTALGKLETEAASKPV